MPLNVKIAFPGGLSLTFNEANAIDLGDWIAPHINQKNLRQRASGNNDHRDGFVVYFRPDADGSRDEVVIEYGTEFDFSKPGNAVPARGVAVAALGPYTATITGGNITTPVVYNVKSQAFSTRWRYQQAERPVVRKLADLIAEKSVPPYDNAYAFGASFPAPVSYDSPGSTGGIAVDMGGTGDRPDIGFITDYQAAFLLTGDASMQKSWRAEAEGAGTLAFYFRDVATGAPVDLSIHQYYATGDAGSTHGIPRGGYVDGQPGLDVSHMPDVSFVPYRLTDDLYHLETSQFNAQYAIISTNYHRFDENLPLLIEASQPRGWGWGLRLNFRMAAYAPATPPPYLLPQSYFGKVLADNRMYAQRFMNAKTSPCTTVFKLIPFTRGVEMFMQDFINTTLGWALWTGQFEEWRPAVEYAASMRINMADPKNTNGWDNRLPYPYWIPVEHLRLGRPNADNYAESMERVPASLDTPTSYSELWTLFNKYMSGQSGWSDPSTWPKGQLFTGLWTYYCAQVRCALAALSLGNVNIVGLPTARACHDNLVRMMNNANAKGNVTGGGYKYAIKPTVA